MDKQLEKHVKELFEQKLRKQIKPGVDYIPTSGKVFDEKELLLGIEAVLDGWWTSGGFSRQFEKQLAGFIGSKNALLCNSGSSANFLAFSALFSRLLGKNKLEKGMRVITTAACFPTTVNPIISAGCVPVFVDVDLQTLNAEPALVEEAIAENTGAIFLTHTLGNPFEVDKIKKMAEDNGLWLLEDSCDALGGSFNEKRVGSLGDVSTFSFYPAHPITMGEGGAVLTDNDSIAKALRSIRDWGRDCRCETGQDNACGNRFGQQHGKLPFGYDHKYVFSHLGYNLKGTDLGAAIGVAQLQKLPFFIKTRQQNFEIMLNLFRDFEGFFLLPKILPKASPSWFGFPLTIRPESGLERSELVRFLEENKIGTRLLFCGNVTKQPYFVDNKFDYTISGSLKNTDLIMQNTFWLGLYPALSKQHFEYMHLVMEKFLRNKK